MNYVTTLSIQELHQHDDLKLNKIKLHDSLSRVRVSGTVDNIVLYPKEGIPEKAYLTLKNSGHVIKVCTPIDKKPTEGKNITVEGAVFVQHNKWYNNFEILIQAHNITHWTPSSVKKGYNEFERRKKTLFFDYLDQQEIPNLLIYGTKIAVEDTVTACNNPLLKKSLLTKVGRVNDPSKLLKGLKEGIERYNPSAVAIVRGGDDDGSLLMWDQVDFLEELFKLNLPIYTGIVKWS